MILSYTNMTSIQQILDAAATLSKIPEINKQCLLSHRNKLEAAFHNLQALLQPSNSQAKSATETFTAPISKAISETSAAPDAPPTTEPTTPPEPGPTSDVSSSLASPRSDVLSLRESTTSDVSPTNKHILNPVEKQKENVPKSVRKIIEQLDERKQDILAYTYNREGFVAPNEWADEYPCIVDIQLVQIEKNDNKYFRAGLSSLFMADEYLAWEICAQNRSRLDVLYEEPDSRKGSLYRKYADINDRFRDKEAAARFLELGVRFRFIQKTFVGHSTVLTHNYEHPESPANPDSPDIPSRRIGILGPLFLVWRAITRCRKRDLEALADALVQDPFWREHAEKNNQWMDTCFKNHKGKSTKDLESRKHALADEYNEERRKRQRQEYPDTSDQNFASSQTNTSFILPTSDFPPGTSAQNICSSRLPVFPNQPGSIPALNINPLGTPLFVEQPQNTLTLNINPLGTPLFVEQPQNALALSIDPLGSDIFLDQPQGVSVPDNDAPTPHSLRLSSPEMHTAVGDVINSLQHTIDNRPCA
ncbi:hypothetical protein BDV29DRAFT_183189 [Aspergillus leporis]|uniref:Uncharacterized protein n=1 Tax=Aspergillus leporis TaxID=41062 RepID=A0A5N5WLP4_9EURO|nr:hypothetical protein BDV29DRAFT_183189 [Aspergillus leporis]